MSTLPAAGEDDKEAIETQISTLKYALDNDIPLSSGFLEDGSGSGDILSGYLGLSGGVGTEYEYGFDFFTTSTLWTCIAAALVFLMHLGFASLNRLARKERSMLFKNVSLFRSA